VLLSCFLKIVLVQEVAVIDFADRALRAVHVLLSLVDQEVQLLNHALLEVRVDDVVDTCADLLVKFCLSIFEGMLESCVEDSYEVGEVYRTDVARLLNQLGVCQGAICFSHLRWLVY